ncbi:MAG: RidA family protein [Bacteroidales bacterium]|nr:RidA family protein [Bacteroidales bacterium]
MKKYVSTNHAPAAVGPYSQAVKWGDVLYLSGQIGIDPATQQLEEGLEAQTKRCFTNVKAILSGEGYSFADIVKVTVYLTDMDDFILVNELYASFLESPFPARSCVAVSALPKGASVEIEVIAAK